MPSAFLSASYRRQVAAERAGRGDRRRPPAGVATPAGGAAARPTPSSTTRRRCVPTRTSSAGCATRWRCERSRSPAASTRGRWWCARACCARAVRTWCGRRSGTKVQQNQSVEFKVVLYYIIGVFQPFFSSRPTFCQQIRSWPMTPHNNHIMTLAENMYLMIMVVNCCKL